MSDLDKDFIQQQVQELESSSSDSAKEKLTIAQSKIAALNSTYYEKL